MLKLYTYFRSSAAYRVRIALNLKGLAWEGIPVHLLRGGGEQFAPGYRALNPAGLVPTLVEEGETLTQSLAIIEYLDETHPEPPLMPADALGRARVRAIAHAIASDIHPIGNLRVIGLLETLGVPPEGRAQWRRHWVEQGFEAIEQLLASPATGRFCHGDTPTLADCCLVPQAFNARRFDIALDRWPTLRRIVDECATVAAFSRAAPGVQPDAE